MRDFFFGYYYKFQSATRTVAVIAAKHTGATGAGSSIQIITDKQAWNFDYPVQSFVKLGKDPNARIGNCIFSEKGVRLSIHEKGCDVEGFIQFLSNDPIAYDIMGPFAFVPFMECKHSIYSMQSRLDGTLTINGEIFDFHGAKGYIEGDRGYSFPQKYIWTQNLFDEASLTLAVASIPFGPASFTGVMGIVLLGNKEYRLATYLGAYVKEVGKNRVVVAQGPYTLEARLLDKTVIPLKAPDLGNMTRMIRENTSCKARYIFKKGSKALLDAESPNASFEFEYD